MWSYGERKKMLQKAFRPPVVLVERCFPDGDVVVVPPVASYPVQC